MDTPAIARTRAELDAARGDSSVSFVPTMGALHDGHLQLLKHARPLGETLVASIFVNPTQFAPGEDFEAYPRTFDDDLERCAEAGVDVVFAPAVETMYPSGLVDTVTVDPGPLGAVLEGAVRPTHFRGVLTVVAKLFGLVRPDVAVFGEKDYQQLTLIRHMASELALGVEIVGCPTVRESDGLAMSSRNRYLSPEERQQAAYLSAALRAGVAAGPNGADAVLAAARAVLESAGITPDYLVLADPDLGEAQPGAEARLLVAARVGSPRLLDNTALTLGA
ncbi:pantoate--beta-alanine ligase [Aeromicrobium sp.]|uniref:pantoate--beta-alanine ligase n=1 Tax=Aeromicrobium sp. TaxID=1871063 RepID=UPI002FCBF47B